ncbi:MAG TPA: hypothetical protein VF201_15860 [Nitrolancea sp.]
MQTVIRYSVVNQDGKPVIRAVPVRRWSDDRAEQQHEQDQAVEQPQPTVLRKLRRLRVLDIR